MPSGTRGFRCRHLRVRANIRHAPTVVSFMAKQLLLAATLLLQSACVPHFPTPMSAAQLEQFDSGAALVAYLAQPGAETSVCDMGSTGPHLHKWAPQDSKAWVDGLVDGEVSQDVWRACATALLRSAPSTALPELLHAAGRGYRRLLRQLDFEDSYQAQTRVIELHRLYLRRSPTLQPPAAAARELFEELRSALFAQHLGPYATKLATQLLTAYDLEHGRWRGRALDVATLDALFAARDLEALHMIRVRSSSEQLRSEAKRRIIRLHIATSTFPEVKANSAEVEETLMRLGHNPQDPKTHPVLSGTLGKLRWQSVSVRQNLAQQTASLIGRGSGHREASTLPLRGALSVKLQGLSQPVTLCADATSLDPTPCIAAKHVSLGHPLARIHNNQLELKSGVRIADTLDLARGGSKLELRVRVAGVVIEKHALPLRFDNLDGQLRISPKNDRYGERGHALRVSVDCPDNELLRFTATADGMAQRDAFVHVADLDRFRLENHGRPGEPGVPGSDGSRGMAGVSCSDGGPGGDGSSGGPGGPGGDGGDIRVEITCRDGVHGGVGFALLRDILQRIVHSIGGEGGPGGPGGRGGEGGFAGSSRPRRTHVDNKGVEWVDDKGCSAGNSGRDGSAGLRGPRGRDGRPGSVTIVSGQAVRSQQADASRR